MSQTCETVSLRGATTPRINVIPAYVDTYGPEAIDLAKLAGLELDVWQQDAVKAILAFRDDRKWTCFEYVETVSRQNGKGGILEARALAGMFLLGEKLIMWSAHEYKTSTEAFLRMRALIHALERERVIHPGSIRVVGGHGDETIENRDTGQRIKFLARSKSSGRGFSGDVNIIDETFAYTATQHAALMPTMSARDNPQIIYTSTPPLDGDSGDILFDLKERALMGGDTSLGFRDWGAAGTLDELSKINLDDRRMWADTNPALGIRITEETITRERRSLGRLEFARERCGIWPKRSTGGGVIDAARWRSLANPSSCRTGDCALGVDIALDRSAAAIGLYGHGLASNDGTPLGHMQLVKYNTGTQWIVPSLVALCDVLNPVSIGLGRGTFASLESELVAAGFAESADPDKPKRRDLLVLNGSDMAAACGHLIDAVRDGTMRVKPDATAPEVLDAAVVGAHIRQTTDAVTWSKKGTADIAPLAAVTCARYAFVTRVNSVTAVSAFFGAWR